MEYDSSLLKIGIYQVSKWLVTSFLVGFLTVASCLVIAIALLRDRASPMWSQWLAWSLLSCGMALGSASLLCARTLARCRKAILDGVGRRFHADKLEARQQSQIVRWFVPTLGLNSLDVESQIPVYEGLLPRLTAREAGASQDSKVPSDSEP